MKKAEIIAVGSELLTPYRSDTNSLWITSQLNARGIDVIRKHIIGDDRAALAELIKEAGERSDYVLVTGGLGPTFDDITREALSDALDVELVYRQKIFDMLAKLWARRQMVPTENNRQQAYVPKGGEFVLNPVGTAPGLFIEKDGTRYALFPGPPDELHAVFKRMQRKLFADNGTGQVFTRKFKLSSIGESLAEEKLGKIALPENANWSILASPGQVEAHLHVNTASETDAEPIFRDFEKHIIERIGQHYFGIDDDELESVVGALLNKHDHIIATAESCTGGWLARRITNVSGSSGWFRAGFVTYANEAKVAHLGVDEDLLEKHGAVSREVALAMAHGARRIDNADVSCVITGVAGPTGGTEEKPVGTVFIAVIDANNVEHCHHFHFIGDRERIRFQSTQSALDMIRLSYSGEELDSSYIVRD